MIEAVTITQRELHDRYTEIHQRFFPKPKSVCLKIPEIIEPILEIKPALPPPTLKPDSERDWLLVATSPAPLSIAKINRAVAAKWKVDVNDIRSERRTNDIVVPRQIVCLLARILTLKSYPSIGRFMGGRDHTTALASVRKFNWLAEQLRKELDSGAPLGMWVDRAFELTRKK